MKSIFTVCTSDYAWHLPLWAWSAKRLWPDVRLVVVITGTELPALVCDYVKILGGVVGIQNRYLPLPAMSACLRFVYDYSPQPDEEILITDADVVFLHDGLWRYMENKMKTLGCYGAFTGAKKKPRRPEIAPQGWVGNMRRLTGTFVLVTPEWYNKTAPARTEWSDRLMRGMWGTFREADEVMLTRIIAQSGLPLPDETPFAKVMRGLHVGDFRPNMQHRWGNPKRIEKWFPEESATTLRILVEDKEFQYVLGIARTNPIVDTTWTNVFNHLKDRPNG
jgi:hypothetical protein